MGFVKTSLVGKEGRWHLDRHKALPFNLPLFLRRKTVVSSAMKSLPCLHFKKDNTQIKTAFTILAPKYTSGTFIVSNN